MNYVKERSSGKGSLIFSPYDSGQEEEWHSITCCHCNHSFIVIPGAGKERGWCFMCGASTCGARPCNPALNGCGPFEKKLETYERLTRVPMDGPWDLIKGAIWVKTMNETKLKG